MHTRSIALAASAAAVVLVAGCASPLAQPQRQDGPLGPDRSLARTLPEGVREVPRSAYRGAGDDAGPVPTLSADSTPDDYVRYALFNSPGVEAAYQQWRVAAERLPQVASLPDPRVTLGFFLDEVETRTGAQQAKFGVQQTFPWPGRLRTREDAASRAAAAAWRRFEAAGLSVTQRVVSTMHELAYLDGAIGITTENLGLLRSFEEVLRARYTVGAGSHPELIRVQVELGQLDDRLTQLRAMRPAYVADLNAALHRGSGVDVPTLKELPGRVASVEAAELAAMARRSNPALLALDEQVEEQRSLGEAARLDALPDLTVGLDYIVTDEATNSALPESGDDPILLSFGINVPLWRGKYDAGVRESIARRLSVASNRADQANRVASGVYRAWFEHTNADRRARLYERTLIPKAEESLLASLAGFRAGETSFLDLLDTERTLLEFAIAAERARADRGIALARLNTLVGEPVPTEPAPQGTPEANSDEVQP